MDKSDILKKISNIHHSIESIIKECFFTNCITIKNIVYEFKKISIEQLRNFIQELIISKMHNFHDMKNIVNMGLAFPIGINGDALVAHHTPIKTPVSIVTPYYINKDTLIGQFKILKIDFGIQINGYIIDKAFTINIHKTELEQLLIDASSEAVNTIIKEIGVDTRLNELADSAREIIESYEFDNKHFKIVENVYSHNIKQWNVHGGKFIMPDYRVNNLNKNDIVKEDEQYAIEFYASNGAGYSKLLNEPSFHSHFKLKDKYMNDKIPLFQVDKLNVMSGAIRSHFNILPFCPNFLDLYNLKIDKKKINHAKTIKICQDLQSVGIIESYPPIIELDPMASVSQLEKNVYIDSDSKKVYL